MSGGQATDQRDHILGDVASSGFTLHLGGEVERGILESLGGYRSDQEIEMITHLLSETILPGH